MHAGNTLKILRHAEDLSQREFAERIGVARTYLAQVESGKRTPGLVLLRRAASELKVPVALLLADEDAPDAAITAELRNILNHVLEARTQIKKRAP